ncbi:hypothetical protein GQ55_5G108800 [Panicum hallii var. hallii]|uniref:Uncharacterized protein n=1 Tax=Panicum hallii var. hallii TaxID=1504633 RepID=A0A2T7DF37_9POAL|nr:hypothetical protein GQ55_5G108800 [Panicum hallii var. hallii]
MAQPPAGPLPLGALYIGAASLPHTHHKEFFRVPIKKHSCAHAQRSSTTTAAADDDINMGNSLRCCLACMVPCGALDVVRIVHLSGHVDEFSCPVAAASVLAANPNHTLTTAWSPSGAPGCASKKLVIVSPDSELKRGRIYFLIPSATLPADRRSKKQGGSKKSGGGKRPGRHHHAKKSAGDTAEQDNYLRELLSEKTASSGGHRRRRSGARVGVWRPQLESIVEEASD